MDEGSLWDVIPIEVVWVASLFRLIGGGPAIAIAASLTMVSDLSEEAVRSNNFYRVYSAVLATDLIGPLITYKTLEHSLLLPFVVCGISLFLTFPILYIMPETLPGRSQREGEMSLFDISGIKIYLKFFANPQIALGIITIFLAQFRANLIEILLPYASVRFGLELGKVAMFLSVVSAVNIVTFLVVLPAVSKVLERRAAWTITQINILVAQASSLLLALGASVLTLASTIGLVIFGLMIYAMGFGIRLSILAVLTSFIASASETGKLYTLVATTDAIAHLIASPLLQYVWSRALAIGGHWLVLPFVVLTGIFLLSFFTSCFMKSHGDKNDEAHADRSLEEHDPLLASDGDSD